jgi:hypothetical protein
VKNELYTGDQKMSFIRRLTDSIQIFTTPEQQPQETTPTQNQTNLGVANTTDLFESAAPNNFDLLQQQIQTQTPIQESTPPEVTVDASSLFLAVAPDAPPSSPRLQELQERLKAINERRKEILDPKGDLIKLKEESLQLTKAAQEIRSAAENNTAVSNSVAATLGSLGMVGLIAGLPIPQLGLGILGAFGLTGYSEADKQKMYKAAAELEKKAGEKDLESSNLRAELDDLDKQAESVAGLIDEEVRRLSQGFDEFTYTSNFIEQTPWQDYRPTEDLIQSNDAPSVFLFNPEKLTTDE